MVKVATEAARTNSRETVVAVAAVPGFCCAGMLSLVRGYFAKSDRTTEALLLVIVSFFFLHVSLAKY